ncbi:hypothetical protein EVA_09363 [gut metagenome]|uniref:Uncharacterized protein n=1 Tax=gut metagenome TaxID=749906 RepID=J9G6Q8_9ZZZZ
MNIITAQPNTIVIKIPLAIAVYLPRPSTAMLKIAPHITEVQRPTRRKAKIPTGTSCHTIVRLPQSTPGKLTFTSTGANIPNTTRAMVNVETVVIMARLLTLLPMLAPTKRPINIMNQ